MLTLVELEVPVRTLDKVLQVPEQMGDNWGTYKWVYVDSLDASILRIDHLVEEV
jgi:hypothetical protein